MGWVVHHLGPGSVSYRYSDSPFVLDPGFTVEGFCFYSDMPVGEGDWSAYGEGLGYHDKTVVGATDAILIADCITSAGALPLKMDASGRGLAAAPWTGQDNGHLSGGGSAVRQPRIRW